MSKRILLVLIILAVISPIGLYLPEIFNAGDAWGEWDTKTVKEQTGFTPEGMAKDAEIWDAPLPDYSLDEDNPSSTKQALLYILSGFIGIAGTILVLFGISRLLIKKKE